MKFILHLNCITNFFCEIFPSDMKSHFQGNCIWKPNQNATTNFGRYKQNKGQLCLAANCAWCIRYYFHTANLGPNFQSFVIWCMADHTKHEHCLWLFCERYQSCICNTFKSLMWLHWRPIYFLVISIKVQGQTRIDLTKSCD